MNKLANLQNRFCLKNIKCVYNFHTSSARFIDQDWRKKHRLASNPNSEGPLVNLADFTYMDGRPTPLGRRQMQRIQLQRKFAQNIVTGSQEIEFAINRHKRMLEEKAKAEQNILDNKLKPKGDLLIKKDKK